MSNQPRRTKSITDENQIIKDDIQNNEEQKIDNTIENSKNVDTDASNAQVKEFEYKYMKKPDVPLYRVVKVLNGTYGRLSYTDPKTNVKMIWDGFGQENYMTVEDLVNMRSHHLKFFSQNWVMFSEEDTDVLYFLGVEKYYTNVTKLEDLNILFTLTPEEISEKVKGMSDGMKRTIANRAYEMIKNDEIYDKRIIKVLEETTGYELVE